MSRHHMKGLRTQTIALNRARALSPSPKDFIASLKVSRGVWIIVLLDCKIESKMLAK